MPAPWTPSHPSAHAPLAWNLYSAYWLLPFQMGFGKDRLIEADGSVVRQRYGKYRGGGLYDGMGGPRLGLHQRARCMLANSSQQDGHDALVLVLIPELEKLGIGFETVAFPNNQQLQRPVVPLAGL